MGWTTVAADSGTSTGEAVADATVGSRVEETPMELTTVRLRFRPYTPDDFPLLLALDSDPAVTQMRGGTTILRQRYEERFARILQQHTVSPRQHYDFVVLTRDDARLVGHCFLHITNGRTQDASLGYFFHPSAWGQGFATETAHGLIHVGFGLLGMHRIGAGCSATNQASARVLAKVGMQCEGRVREDRLTDAGERDDTVLYGILRREWARSASSSGESIDLLQGWSHTSGRPDGRPLVNHAIRSITPSESG